VNETDPAWFYSSLAQASAAIVGLVGAVLGGRILDHVALMRGQQKEVDGEIDRAYRALLARATEWSRFREYLEREIADDDAAMTRGESTRSITAWMS
jgi:hypothetical protein